MTDCCLHFLYISRWKCHKLEAGQQLLPGQTVWYCKAGGMDVHHVQNHTCFVTLLQPASRTAVLGEPSSLWQRWASTLTSRSNARHQSNSRPSIETSKRSYFFEHPKGKIVPSTAIFVDRCRSRSLGIVSMCKNIAPYTSTFPKV
jgi:hypothetical protein